MLPTTPTPVSAPPPTPELACLRDRVWFDAGGSVSTGRGLAAYVRRHASGLLRAVGAHAEPRPAADGAEAETYAPTSLEDEEGMVAARRRWRWVTFALPPDLLLAALLDAPPPSRVVALAPMVQSALELGGSPGPDRGPASPRPAGGGRLPQWHPTPPPGG